MIPTAIRTRRSAHLATYTITLGDDDLTVHVRDGQRGRILHADDPTIVLAFVEAGLLAHDGRDLRLTLAGARLCAAAAQDAIHASDRARAQAARRAVEARAWTAATDYAEALDRPTPVLNMIWSGMHAA